MRVLGARRCLTGRAACGTGVFRGEGDPLTLILSRRGRGDRVWVLGARRCFTGGAACGTGVFRGEGDPLTLILSHRGRGDSVRVLGARRCLTGRAACGTGILVARRCLHRQGRLWYRRFGSKTVSHRRGGLCHPLSHRQGRLWYRLFCGGIRTGRGTRASSSWG